MIWLQLATINATTVIVALLSNWKSGIQQVWNLVICELWSRTVNQLID